MVEHLSKSSHERGLFFLAIPLVVFLFAGQGLRYALGLPGYTVVAVILLGLLLWCGREELKRLRPPILLVAFLVLTSVTLIWSQTFWLTLVALGALLATSLAGLILVRTLSLRTLALSLYRGLQICLFGSLVFELLVAIYSPQGLVPLHNEWLSLVGDEGIAQKVLQWSNGFIFQGGPIQGLMGNRNLLGFVALLSGIAAPFLMREKLVRGWDAAVTMLAAFLTHILTGSATVTFIAVVVAILAIAAYLIRGAKAELRRTLSWGFVVLAGVAASVSYYYRDGITSLLGREPDLTNRTEIWRAVFDQVLQYPQGTGWVSYWPIWLEPYKGILTLGGTPVAQAHNAFLDVWLQAGPLAALVLLGLILTSLVSGWEDVELGRHGASTLPLLWVLFLVALTLQAVSESRLLLEGNWFLLVIATTAVPQLIRNRGKVDKLRSLT